MSTQTSPANPTGTGPFSDNGHRILNALLAKDADPATAAARHLTAARALVAAGTLPESVWDGWLGRVTDKDAFSDVESAAAVLRHVMPHLPTAVLRSMAAKAGGHLANALADVLADDAVSRHRHGRVAALVALVEQRTPCPRHMSAAVLALSRLNRGQLKRAWPQLHLVSDRAAMVATINYAPLPNVLSVGLTVGQVKDPLVADALARRLFSVVGRTHVAQEPDHERLGVLVAALTHPAAGTSPKLRRRLSARARQAYAVFDGVPRHSLGSAQLASRDGYALARAYASPDFGPHLLSEVSLKLYAQFVRQDADLLGALLAAVRPNAAAVQTVLDALVGLAAQPAERAALEANRARLDALVDAHPDLTPARLRVRGTETANPIKAAFDAGLVRRVLAGDVAAFRLHETKGLKLVSDEDAVAHLPWQDVVRTRPHVLADALVRIDAVAGGDGVNLFLELAPTTPGTREDLEAAVLAALSRD